MGGMMSDNAKITYVDDVKVAELLGLAVGTIRNMRWRGDGPPYIKLNHTVRYSLEDVHSWMESRKINLQNR
jgi:predicted DNA-binding transcriptional regulator AlpA